MKICFTYNVKHNNSYSTGSSQEDLEFDSQEVITSIEKALQKLGHKVFKVEANLDAYNILKENRKKIDLVFNIAEGLSGDARESQIPLFCEMLKIPYTHSSPTTHALKLNKHLAKAVLKSAGIRSPKSQIVESTAQLKTLNLKYPLIVKPNKEGSSKGIFNDSVVRDMAGLKKAVNRLLKNFGVEVLVEEYIDGRELTVALLGNPPKVLPIIEQKFDFLPKGFNKIAGYETKWIYEDRLDDLSKGYACPAKLSKTIQNNVEKTSLKIWHVLNVKDCARIDYRLKGNALYFIEINTLPGINPDEKMINYFPLAARKAGISFEKLVDTLINSALKRQPEV